MIKTFNDSETKKVWLGELSKKLPTQIQQVARRKMRMLNNALTINDLRIPPANRLEKLKGELKGIYSIRINDQWRLLFKWRTGDAYDVEIIDYHD